MLFGFLVFDSLFEIFSDFFLLIGLFGWMVEVAVGTFPADTLHMELTILFTLVQMHEWTLLLFTGTSFKISAYFASFHLP